MEEEKLLQIIKSIIGNEYIGDDCAYLKDLGLLVTQDSLVEDVHFSLKYFNPYQLGYKSAMVNLSDISASGGIGKYMTIALSLPKTIDDNFVKDFYLGINQALIEYGDIKVVGGDLTGSDKVVVSITVIGTDKNCRISSRANAKTGQVIVVSGNHGSSGGGLDLLMNNKFSPASLIEAHIAPKAQFEFAKNISLNIKEDYAMADSSDGLADALYKIAQASGKTLVVDFNSVPVAQDLKKCFPQNYRELVLYGGEDYQIIATVPEKFAIAHNLKIIGQVHDKQSDAPLIINNYNDRTLFIRDLNGCFKHF